MKEKKRKECKECSGRIPQGKSLFSWYCQVMGYCRRCYSERFPTRKMWNLPPLRRGTQRLLSYDELREHERNQFEGREAELWSPEFYAEWLEYMEAKDRGEIR